MAARGVLRTLADGRVAFWCSGCHEAHAIPVVHPDGGPQAPGAWAFNGDVVRPTFAPSILVSGTQPITEAERLRILAGETISTRPRVCHSYVTDGRIQFLADCTHDLAGCTVDLSLHINGG